MIEYISVREGVNLMKYFRIALILCLVFSIWLIVSCKNVQDGYYYETDESVLSDVNSEYISLEYTREDTDADSESEETYESFTDYDSKKVFHAADCEWEGPVAYLTFDDGPSITRTLPILDILDEYNIKATFFIIGGNVNENTESVLLETAQRGHIIGNHTTTHFGAYKNFEHFKWDVDETTRIIHRVTGQKTFLFRYPGGSNMQSVSPFFDKTVKFLEEEGLIYFDWHTSCGDGSGSVVYTAEQLRDNTMRNVSGQDHLVILMHDSGIPASGKGHDLEGALPLIIESLYEKGYRFSELKPTTPTVRFRSITG